MNETVRVLFQKTGRARYISHLDLQHTIQRSFARAGIIMKHSNGFNPHPMMSIALPLPLGCESICEIMDFVPETAADCDDLPSVMNSRLPDGIRFLQAYVPSRKVTEIKWIRTEGFWNYDCLAPVSELQTLFGRERLLIEKKTKRGTAEIDLKESARSFCFETQDHLLRFSAELSAQMPTVNPELILKAVNTYLPEIPAPSAALFRRIELLDDEGRVFR